MEPPGTFSLELNRGFVGDGTAEFVFEVIVLELLLLDEQFVNGFRSKLLRLKVSVPPLTTPAVVVVVVSIKGVVDTGV
jgi:hypothetical protein